MSDTWAPKEWSYQKSGALQRPDLSMTASEKLWPDEGREGKEQFAGTVRSDPATCSSGPQRTGHAPRPKKHTAPPCLGPAWEGPGPVGWPATAPAWPELGGGFAQSNSNLTKKPFLEWGCVGEPESKAHFIAPFQTPSIVRALAPLKPR